MSDDNTQDTPEPSPASAGSVGSDLYGGGFNEWLASIGKTREEATDADDIQWLKLDRHRLNNLWRWIPVTERLPDIGQHVAALTAGGRRFVGYMATLYSRHCWIDRGNEVAVTHWMPLPAPPTDCK